MTQPPNTNPEAEAVCLAMALLAPEVQDEIADALRVEDFAIEAHRAIWRATLGLRAEGAKADMLAIPAWLRRNGGDVGGVTSQTLADLCNLTPAAANVLQHARLVASLGRVRRVHQALQVLVAEGRSDVDPETWVEAAAARVAEAAAVDGTAQDEPEQLGDVAVRVTAEIIRRTVNTPGLRGIPTGIRSWDTHVMGLEPGKVYIVAGRPGSGKTVFATQAALGIARDDSAPGVGVFSLEMTREELAMRMLTQTSLVGHRDMQTGGLSTSDWGKVNRAQELFRRLPIVLDDRNTLSVENLEHRTRRMGAQLTKRGNPMRVVIFDYLQLVHPGRRAQNREQEVAQVSRACKDLAKEQKVAVILLSQLSRPEKGKEVTRPRLSDLRESGSIEQDADVVTFTHAPTEDTRELIVAKGRHCGLSILPVQWDPEHVRFGTSIDLDDGLDDR